MPKPNDDAIIREALRQEDAWLDTAVLDEPPLHEVILRSFRGRRRWLTIFPIFLSLLYTGLMVWCGVRFFQEADPKLQLAWAVGFLLCAASVGLTKIYVWGEWRRQSMTREIKRIELRVVELAKLVSQKDQD